MKGITKLLLFVLLLMAVCTPYGVRAEEGKNSIHMNIVDTKTKTRMADIRYSIYRVATEDNQRIVLTEAFKGAGAIAMNLLNATQINEVVKQLDQYVIEKKVLPVATEKSDENGRLTFLDLEDGIYLIRQTNTPEDFETMGFTYTSSSFLVLLPGLASDGTRSTSVQCNPKGIAEYPTSKPVSVTVNKIWKDQNDKKGHRPTQITVGLYADGKLKEKVILNSRNNWTYEWKNLDKDIRWTVDEIDVPSTYESTISSVDNVFMIENKLKDTEEDTETTETTEEEDTEEDDTETTDEEDTEKEDTETIDEEDTEKEDTETTDGDNTEKENTETTDGDNTEKTDKTTSDSDDASKDDKTTTSGTGKTKTGDSMDAVMYTVLMILGLVIVVVLFCCLVYKKLVDKEKKTQTKISEK